MVKRVVLRNSVAKRIARGRIPREIGESLRAWVARVVDVGLEEVRKIPGYHDEPLRGDRAGQRSVRLNKGWRAFYVLGNDGTIYVEVIEVNHHDY